MSGRVVLAIARKELRDAQRSRWFLLMAAMFAALALLLSYLGMSGLGTFGVAGFGRTTASLLNLVVLIVPLMGLLSGAMSLAAEREHGTLITLLAQPVVPAEIFVGKLLGLAAALVAAIVVGFGISGLVIARYSGWGQLPAYLVLAGTTVLLAFAHLALGLWISAGARRSATALGAALLVWLLVVFISDLGVMGTAMVLKLKPAQVLWLALANPAQAFKLAVLRGVQGHLESAGSAGIYAASRLGALLLPVLLAALLAWTAVPLALALRLFQRRGAL